PIGALPEDAQEPGRGPRDRRTGLGHSQSFSGLPRRASIARLASRTPMVAASAAAATPAQAMSSSPPPSRADGSGASAGSASPAGRSGGGGDVARWRWGAGL